VLLVLSFLLFVVQLINFDTLNASANSRDSLPISMRASSLADYSRDTDRLIIPPISGRILYQIISDEEGTGNSDDRILALQNSLASPVPTVAYNFQVPVTSMPTLTLPTPTSLTASPALPVTLTAPPTATFYFQPTPTAAQLVLPPTSTPSPKNTKRPKPTHPPHPTRKPKP
jgi:hypothetical protein